MPNGTPSQAPAASETGQKQASGPDPLIGRLINDRFKISALIARGGMGKVYKAEQAPLGRQCALKVLNPNYSGEHDPEFHKRFFLEASISAKLTHPNTVTIFDYGRTDDNIYYMAMELLEGRTLHRALREEGPFTEERATHIARQICRSLREAHSLGVIHRDLKPANVYLIEHGDETDFVKVLDFGLAKVTEREMRPGSIILTQEGMVFGTPEFMSPEQAQGKTLDARSDIYSLAVILYEVLTGKLPFDAKSPMEFIQLHVQKEPIPLSQRVPGKTFPPELDAAMAKALRKEKEDRQESAAEFAADLQRSLDVLQGRTPAPSAPPAPHLQRVSGAPAPNAGLDTATPDPPARKLSMTFLVLAFVLGAGLAAAIAVLALRR